MAREEIDYTTEENVQLYETTEPLLEAMYGEVKELSKKKPDGTLNPTKVKIINRLLSDIKIFLEYEPDSKYLDLLDDETLPQYSDVVIILSQFSAAVEKFRSKYYGFDDRYAQTGWLVSED